MKMKAFFILYYYYYVHINKCVVCTHILCVSGEEKSSQEQLNLNIFIESKKGDLLARCVFFSLVPYKYAYKARRDLKTKKWQKDAMNEATKKSFLS